MFVVRHNKAVTISRPDEFGVAAETGQLDLTRQPSKVNLFAAVLCWRASVPPARTTGRSDIIAE